MVRTGISWVRISPEECARTFGVWMHLFVSHATAGRCDRLQVRSRVAGHDPFGKLRARQAQGRLLGTVWLFFNYMGSVKGFCRGA